MSGYNTQLLDTGRVVVMGRGEFALGAITCPATNLLGITYLPLATRREVDQDCANLFKEGEPAVNPAAVIYFSTPQSVIQTIALLTQLHNRMVAANMAAAAIEDAKNASL